MKPLWIRPPYGLGPGLAALTAVLVIQATSTLASAAPMDVALERLVEDPACRTPNGEAVFDGSGNVIPCQADDEAFLRLVNQYASAIAPSAMYPARTTGFGGFEIALEGQYTTVNSNADYMALGTRGAKDPTTGAPATYNSSVDSMFQLYSLRIRKGFGFGLETGLQFGYLTHTNIIAGGFDARLALLEGFRKGLPGYLPDLAAGGSIRTITGTAQLQLTVVGVNGVISKPFTVAKSGVLTPWAGYQYLWIFGDSGTIDFTPATDALNTCGFSGPNQPGFEEPDDSRGRDGGPICSTTNEDFNNNQVFRPARLERQRLFFGMNYRYEFFTIGGQFMFDVIADEDAQTNDPDGRDAAELAKDPAQYSFALQLGAQF